MFGKLTLYIDSENVLTWSHIRTGLIFTAMQAVTGILFEVQKFPCES